MNTDHSMDQSMDQLITLNIGNPVCEYLPLDMWIIWIHRCEHAAGDMWTRITSGWYVNRYITQYVNMDNAVRRSIIGECVLFNIVNTDFESMFEYSWLRRLVVRLTNSVSINENKWSSLIRTSTSIRVQSSMLASTSSLSCTSIYLHFQKAPRVDEYEFKL